MLAFVTAYNFAKHLKRLRWRTPFQAVCDAWTKDPAPFKINPHQVPEAARPLPRRWLGGHTLVAKQLTWEEMNYVHFT